MGHVAHACQHAQALADRHKSLELSKLKLMKYQLSVTTCTIYSLSEYSGQKVVTLLFYVMLPTSARYSLSE